jgi:hypothetical protein
MYSVTDFLDEKRQEITARLNELKPLVDEYSRLEAAVSALAGVGGSTSTATPRRRGPGRPRGSANRASKKAASPIAPAASTPAASTPAKAERKKPGRPRGSGKKVGRPAGKVGRPAGKVGRPARKAGRPKGRVGRRKGSGTRAAQALSFVQGQPGITIPELAAKMSIKQNYLYRVLPGLEQEGKLEKKGRGWHPKA